MCVVQARSRVHLKYVRGGGGGSARRRIPTQKPNSVYSGTYPAQKGDLTQGRKPGPTAATTQPSASLGLRLRPAHTPSESHSVLSKQSATETGILSELFPLCTANLRKKPSGHFPSHIWVICGADAEGCEQQRHAARHNRKTGRSAGRSESYVFIFRAKIGLSRQYQSMDNYCIKDCVL
jgi:hypothetical protein